MQRKPFQAAMGELELAIRLTPVQLFSLLSAATESLRWKARYILTQIPYSLLSPETDSGGALSVHMPRLAASIYASMNSA
jgi:hypothetical protein